MRKIVAIITAGLFLSNQLGWAYPCHLRPPASAKTSVSEGLARSFSAGDSRQGRASAIRGILEDLPDEVYNLGSLFRYLLTIKKEILEDFPTNLAKYDELVEICCGWGEEEFDDEDAWYIIKQAQQIRDPRMEIELASEKGDFIEFKVTRTGEIVGPAGIKIKVEGVRCREGTDVPKDIRFSVEASSDLPIIRPDRNLRYKNFNAWKVRVTENRHLAKIATTVKRKFFSEDWQDTIWIGDRAGYQFRIKSFFEGEEAEVLYKKGFLCTAEIIEPDEDYVPPGVLLREGDIELDRDGYAYLVDMASGGGIGLFESIEILPFEKIEGWGTIRAKVKWLDKKEPEIVGLDVRVIDPSSLKGGDFSWTGVDEIDRVLKKVLEEDIINNKDAMLVTLRDKIYGIDGIGTIYNDQPFLGLHFMELSDDPVAKVHEIAHVANAKGLLSSQDILKWVEDRDILQGLYYDKLKKHGYTPETAPEQVKLHYAMRALMEYKNPKANARLRSDIHRLKLQRLAGRWQEIFADIAKATKQRREVDADDEIDYGLGRIIDYSSFNEPDRMYKSDRRFVDEFLCENVQQFRPPPPNSRKGVSKQTINNALEGIKKSLKPVDDDSDSTSRHLRQRKYDENVFKEKVEHFKVLAGANLDTDEKSELVLRAMAGFLEDSGESLFSTAHRSGRTINKDDRVFQPVLMACVFMVLDAVADLNPKKTALALTPLLKHKQLDSHIRPKIEDLLIKCLKTEKDADIKKDIALKIIKSAEGLPEEERHNFVNRVIELIPKIKVYVKHIVALAGGEYFETDGPCNVEAGSKLKEALPLLGIPMINDQVVEIERDGASLKADYIKGEILQEDDRVTVMSEMGGDFESLLKLAAKNGIIRPDTFTEGQKEGLIFIMLVLKQAGYEILRQMKDLSYEQRDTYGELEKIGTVNVFSEKVYEIISELGSTKAKLFLKEFVLPVIKENKVPLLYNIFPEWSYFKLFGPVTAVLRYAGGYEGINKALELCYREPTWIDETKERVFDVKKMVAIFSRIGQQMEYLTPDEFKAWLNEFLSVAKFEEISYYLHIYIVQESSRSFVYYSSDTTDYKPFYGITIFSEALDFKTLDEAKKYLELMQECRIEIMQINENVLKLIDFFSGPVGRKVVKGFAGFKREYGVGGGVRYLDRDKIIGDRFHDGLGYRCDLGYGSDGIEKKGDTLIVHFDSSCNFEVDITGLSFPGPRLDDNPYELRLRFCIMHEIPIGEQGEVDVSERDRPTLIYDKRQTPQVVWEADIWKGTFVKRESKSSSAGAVSAAELRQSHRVASALAIQA